MLSGKFFVNSLVDSQKVSIFASQSTIYYIHETNITDLTADCVQHFGLFAGKERLEIRGNRHADDSRGYGGAQGCAGQRPDLLCAQER